MGEVEDHRNDAEKCRRLARAVLDERNKRQLLELADACDEQAEELEEMRSTARPASRFDDADRELRRERGVGAEQVS